MFMFMIELLVNNLILTVKVSTGWTAIHSIYIIAALRHEIDATACDARC